jgi:hypothetical protein
VHSTLVESQLVGALNGAKAIVIALPEGKCKEVEGFTRESLPKVLQDFSKRHLGGKVPILIAHNNELARGLVRGNISINLEKGLAVSPEIQEEMQKSFSKSDKFTSEHKDMESKESWVQKMVSRTPGGSMEV